MLGQRIENARVDRDVTQQQLANMIHVSQSVVSRWESGAVEPGVYNIMEICKVLQIDPREFFMYYLK